MKEKKLNLIYISYSSLFPCVFRWSENQDRPTCYSGNWIMEMVQLIIRRNEHWTMNNSDTIGRWMKKWRSFLFLNQTQTARTSYRYRYWCLLHQSYGLFSYAQYSMLLAIIILFIKCTIVRVILFWFLQMLKCWCFELIL